MSEIKIKGRIFLEIDVTEADDGDVVRFFDRGWRHQFVTGRRGGKKAAVRVQDCTGAAKWISLRDVSNAWRRRTKLIDEGSV